MDFFEAEIIQTNKESSSCTHIEVKVPQDVLNSYQTPGQYAVIRYPEQKEGFFAIANAPDNDTWEFLIKKDSPLTEQLSNLNRGDKFQITKAQGNGYNLEKSADKNILAICVGSGIAPIRALINYLLDKKHSSIQLYYGSRQNTDRNFSTQIEEWKKSGIEVIESHSNPDENWNGKTGHIWKHLSDNINSESSLAYLCGMKEMTQQTTDRLTKLGFSQDQILMNF